MPLGAGGFLRRVGGRDEFHVDRETEPCLITLRTLMSCSATSGIRPVRSVRPSSVRQLHSLPAAARPSRVRCSRRGSAPRIRRSRVRCSRKDSAPRVRCSRVRCSRVRCSRRDNGLLIRRVRMLSGTRQHVRTPCSRRGSSVLSAPVPRSRMPRPARSSLGICTPNSSSGRSVRARRASRRTPCGRGRSRALYRRRRCRQSPSSAPRVRLSRKCRAAPDAAAVLAA